MRDPAITPFDLIGPGWRHHVTQTRVGGRFVVRSNPLGAIWDAIKGICFPAQMEMDAGGGYAVDNPPDASSYFPATVGSYGFGGLYGGGAVLGPSGQSGQDCGPGTMWDPTLRQCVLQSAGMMTTPMPMPMPMPTPTPTCQGNFVYDPDIMMCRPPCPAGTHYDRNKPGCVTDTPPPPPPPPPPMPMGCPVHATLMGDTCVCDPGYMSDPAGSGNCIPNPPMQGGGLCRVYVQLLGQLTGPLNGNFMAVDQMTGKTVQAGSLNTVVPMPCGTYVFKAVSSDGKVMGMVTGGILDMSNVITVQVRGM